MPSARSPGKEPMHIITCSECGGSFESVRPHALTCGSTCRKRRSVRRARERVAFEAPENLARAEEAMGLL